MKRCYRAAVPERLAFSPDETRLYVADTGRMFGSEPQHICVFDIGSKGKLPGGEVFHAINSGCADAFAQIAMANLWSSAHLYCA